MGMYQNEEDNTPYGEDEIGDEQQYIEEIKQGGKIN